MFMDASVDGKVSILIIDGHHKDRQHYADHLKTCSPDYIVYEAPSAKVGLEFFRSHSIDCVVLELSLPDASGFEVLVKLIPLARKPEVAVVVLTRLNYMSLLQVAREKGAQSILLKSFTSGDSLDTAILRAISTVERDRKRAKLAILHVVNDEPKKRAL